MKIVVLVKQVPVVTAMRFDPGTRRLEREGVASEVSAFDIRALVRAAELRGTLGGEVVVMTMGPPGARAALEHCLALGADRGVHLVDRAFVVREGEMILLVHRGRRAIVGGVHGSGLGVDWGSGLRPGSDANALPRSGFEGPSGWAGVLRCIQ